MDNFDLKEKVYGGIFGVISIVAAIAEMFVNGISVSSILGTIKDVSGTLVVVVLLVAVVKSLIPKKYKKTFEERLTEALVNWEKANSNMIVKDDSYAAGYSLEMRTNVIDFYKSVPIKSKSGWFVRLPIIKVENYNKGNIEINFHLNKGTFFNDRPKEDDLKNDFDKLNHTFREFIIRQFGDFASADGKNQDIKIFVKEPIVTDEDIAKLIALIDTMYQAYLVSANIGGNI